MALRGDDEILDLLSENGFRSTLQACISEN